MPKKLILQCGQRFGNWTVVKEQPSIRDNNGAMRRYALCRCKCGKLKSVRLLNLAYGKSKCCGCTKTPSKHGLSYLPEYGVWRSMIQRCTRTTHASHRHYLTKGITVCERWKKSFLAFLNDMGRRPSNDHSIERIDNHKGYFPGNCKWATRREQARNRSNNRFLSYNGQKKTLSDWALEVGLSEGTLRYRIDKKGFSIHKALTTPAQKGTVR